MWVIHLTHLPVHDGRELLLVQEAVQIHTPRPPVGLPRKQSPGLDEESALLKGLREPGAIGSAWTAGNYMGQCNDLRTAELSKPAGSIGWWRACT